MLGKCCSATLIGVDAYPIELEVHASGRGEQQFVSIVGLPDAAVKESKERIRAALNSCGLPQPLGETVVNLAPADLRKEGGAFDLAIALGMLATQGVVDPNELASMMVIGELALDGRVRAVRGVLPIAMCAAEHPEVTTLILPADNALEGALAIGTKQVIVVSSLPEAVKYIQEKHLSPTVAGIEHYMAEESEWEPDFAEVKGQFLAKRAMEIAAAGGHNSLLIGPPGTGKSMIAKRVSSILPPMTLSETLETSRIHSIMGLLGSGKPLLNRRPYRAPHHTVSDVGLIGGRRSPMPGEISLAHNGVLFLDEFPEFKRNVLEVLREPLENGSITISRAAGSCNFPARFMLIAAMNPCPCGMGDAAYGCKCKPDEKKRYRQKISGPLLDRIDLHVEVLNLSQDELLNAPNGESSKQIRERVLKARTIQQKRYLGTPMHCNAHMGSREIQRYCKISGNGTALLRQAITKFKLSPRAYDRILKVARTIADLDNSPNINEDHLFEAINYRKADRFDEN